MGNAPEVDQPSTLFVIKHMFCLPWRLLLLLWLLVTCFSFGEASLETDRAVLCSIVEKWPDWAAAVEWNGVCPGGDLSTWPNVGLSASGDSVETLFLYGAPYKLRKYMFESATR